MAAIFQHFENAILQLGGIMRVQAFFLQAENCLAIVFLGQNIHRLVPGLKAVAAHPLEGVSARFVHQKRTEPCWMQCYRLTSWDRLEAAGALVLNRMRALFLSEVLGLLRVCFTLGANGLVKRDQPGAKQFNAGAAIHGPFKCLQPIDLSFRLSICGRPAPRKLLGSALIRSLASICPAYCSAST